MTYITVYQGNIRAVTDSTGTAVQTTDCYPYGLPMATSTGQEKNPYKYSGKELETEDGLDLYDFGARQYYPAIAMFNRPDPMAITKPDINPYSYCNGDPVNYTDPTGMDTLRVSYSDNKWVMEDPVIAEGDDVIIVTNGDRSETYTFSGGEYSKRVCALNLEIGDGKNDVTLGVYHVSGNKDAHGYYVTPGGKASTEEGSKARIPDGEYPITTPSGKEKLWRCIGVGGSLLSRGIRFHYGGGSGSALKAWTDGCFVLSSEYKTEESVYSIEQSKSVETYKTFGEALGARSFYDYINSKGKDRIGTRVNHQIKSTFILKSVKP